MRFSRLDGLVWAYSRSLLEIVVPSLDVGGALNVAAAVGVEDDDVVVVVATRSHSMLDGADAFDDE